MKVLKYKLPLTLFSYTMEQSGHNTIFFLGAYFNNTHSDNSEKLSIPASHIMNKARIII